MNSPRLKITVRERGGRSRYFCLISRQCFQNNNSHVSSLYLYDLQWPFLQVHGESGVLSADMHHASLPEESRWLVSVAYLGNYLTILGIERYIYFPGFFLLTSSHHHVRPSIMARRARVRPQGHAIPSSRTQWSSCTLVFARRMWVANNVITSKSLHRTRD